MKPNPDKRLSKFLSYILRHHPDSIGLTLDDNGWADTQQLIDKSNSNNASLTLEQLKILVESNDKKRFVFSPDFSKIRAAQGHSVNIDLQLQERIPPDDLYHGTAQQNIDSIKVKGLVKGERHHVHLSADRTTAKNVGSRYGKPVVLTINSKQMHDDGCKFYQSDNGVWLTDFVLPAYIMFD